MGLPASKGILYIHGPHSSHDYSISVSGGTFKVFCWTWLSPVLGETFFLPGLEPGLNWTYLLQAFFAGFAGLISSPKLGKLNLKCEKRGLGRVRKVKGWWAVAGEFV